MKKEGFVSEDDEVRYDDPVLCLVKDPWAYFTTRQLDQQWGDDWNDSPYEYNAGSPYEFEKDVAPWQVIKIAFEGPSIYVASGGSVEDFIKTKKPWIYNYERTVLIGAGTALTSFVDQFPGSLYFPIESWIDLGCRLDRLRDRLKKRR